MEDFMNIVDRNLKISKCFPAGSINFMISNDNDCKKYWKNVIFMLIILIFFSMKTKNFYIFQ